MKNQVLNAYYKLIFLVLVVLISTLSFPLITSAQSTATPTSGTPVQVTGVVSQILGTTATVAGLPVDVSHITLDNHVVVGSTVKVFGPVVNNIIVAQTVIIVNLTELTQTPTPVPDATLTNTPTVTPTPLGGQNVVVVVEGPVVNIVNNILTIYNFNVQVDPQNPILNVIDIGDDVRAQGSFDNHGVLVATTVSNISSTTIVSGGHATVSLDGPIESIDGNHLVINSVPVQLAPNDPLLAKVHTGDFVRVQGNFQGSGATVILVVVNVTVINNVIINGVPTCRYDVDGMGMGHWHCDDGMGMGMGDDGMGMGMGMGG